MAWVNQLQNPHNSEQIPVLLEVFSEKPIKYMRFMIS